MADASGPGIIVLKEQAPLQAILDFLGGANAAKPVTLRSEQVTEQKGRGNHRSDHILDVAARLPEEIGRVVAPPRP